VPILQTHNLTKTYGNITALDNLDFVVEQGQIMGLLGPNGSGKTTTLGIILGVLRQSSGEFTWFDNPDDPTHRLRIGSILETPNFFPYLDADRNLDIVRQIKQVDKQSFDDLLDFVKLKKRRKSKFSTYSLGMKQRLAIAATLIGDPDVVIFDEPTNGLDPEGIAEVRDTLKRIASQGKTVIMASHMLDEVEKICTHVTIIKKGKMRATGPVGAILSNDLTIEIGSPDLHSLHQVVSQYPGINTVKDCHTYLECSADTSLDISQLNAEAIGKGIAINRLIARKKSLEQEFLQITQN
jgi:ABC-2 type transport system ATP-binding protein